MLPQVGLSHSFEGMESMDIYKKIRPYRKLLGLESMKQKAIEQFLGISREDKYTGGQLIEVYRDYLHTHEKSLYDLLILHNEDDLKALPQIMPLLSYLDIFRSEWTLAGYSLSTASSSLTIVVDCSVKVPVAVTRELPLCRLSIRANQIIIEIRAFGRGN